MIFETTVIPPGGNNPGSQAIAVAAVTAGQSLPIASHASMPAQPQRPSAMATAAPVKKPAPTPPVTSNPPTPSITVPTPPPSVTPTNTNASLVNSPLVPQAPQPPISINSFPNVNALPGANDGTVMSQQQQQQQQQGDLMQPYNALGTIFENKHQNQNDPMTGKIFTS